MTHRGFSGFTLASSLVLGSSVPPQPRSYHWAVFDRQSPVLCHPLVKKEIYFRRRVMIHLPGSPTRKFSSTVYHPPLYYCRFGYGLYNWLIDISRHTDHPLTDQFPPLSQRRFTYRPSPNSLRHHLMHQVSETMSTIPHRQISP